MTSFFKTVELVLKDGGATYDELRAYIAATDHIEGGEKVGIECIEWDQGHQEIVGLREYV